MQKEGAWKKVSNICLAVIGVCFGLLVSSGVLTVLLAVGLMPRYAGRVHQAKHIVLFENMVIWGTMSGTFVSLFGVYARNIVSGLLGDAIQMLYGFFAGIFVGTLAIAIAEMLDALPVFFRRAKILNGLRWIVLAIALGKTVGGYLYFYLKLYEIVG